MMVALLRRGILITIAMGLTNLAMGALVLAEVSLRDTCPFLPVVTVWLIWGVALPALAFLAVGLLITVRRLARTEPPDLKDT